MATFDFPTFKRAIVREVPDTVDKALRDTVSIEPLDVAKCQQEWRIYVQTLRDLGLDVTVIPADIDLPDSLFVEDTCVVIGNTALVTRPAHEKRKGETTRMEETVRNLGLNVHVVESETACLEGGDVIFTGKEIFCGDSVQSNPEGIDILEETFPDYPVHRIFVEYPEFHLLSFVGYPAPGVMTVCDNFWGKDGWDDICEASNYTYRPVWVPDNFGSNCIHVNGSIIFTHEKQKPGSFKVYQEELSDYNLIPLSTEEVTKIDASLTCQSVLF